MTRANLAAQSISSATVPEIGTVSTVSDQDLCESAAKQDINTSFFPRLFPMRTALKSKTLSRRRRKARKKARSRNGYWSHQTISSNRQKRKNGGDVSWFDSLQSKVTAPFEIEHWGHTKLQGLFLEAPALCLLYYPELAVDGFNRKAAIAIIRKNYDVVLNQKFGRIEFVGMSVRKEEASRGVKIGDIYIPLATVAEGTEQSDQISPRGDPLKCLLPRTYLKIV